MLFVGGISFYFAIECIVEWRSFMKKLAERICKKKKMIVILSIFLLLLSFVGMKLTKVNYDILVYLPEEIETIEGQNILTDDFHMGSYSIAVVEHMNNKEVLQLEENIKSISGVNEAISLYDVLGTTIPIEMLPGEIVEKVHQEDTDLLFITFAGSTSSKETLDAVEEIRNLNSQVSQGGMSSMVLDTMQLSEKEILIYIVIAVLFCILILELALDSYVVPFLLLGNIGSAILFNLGSNLFLGQISYITKALVAVLQLGVTTDFSIFLYHSYEKKKKEFADKNKAMAEAICDTFVSVTGSSFTTIAGFLVLCTMQLTLGRDLGIVMAKGVLLGVITVLTLFPSLLLLFDSLIEKTKHKMVLPDFTKLNTLIVKHYKVIFVIFLLLLVPAYLANKKVDVYYKLDKSLPDTLESIKTNTFLKEHYNIVSPEIILVDTDLKNDEVLTMVERLENLEGIDFVLTLAKIKELGIMDTLIDEEVFQFVQNENYQLLLVNSTYDVATEELNQQIEEVNQIVKEYDEKGIIAGEGPLMKDLVKICDTDFKNVNTASIFCIFVILFIVLKSFSLPFLLIIAIEFAIFANIGVSYFGGTVLPFIAPIVLGTIQLGATIDYAILLTTTYLSNRKKYDNKEEAMKETLQYCGHSIFTSGMCFFAATFGVGIYSQIEMIGSLCALISRGAIISMVVVITVLPAILLLFDSLIRKTTKLESEGKNMKKKLKKVTKQVTAWTFIVGLLCSVCPVGVFALTKNETVYSKLETDGTVKTTLVSEQLLNTEKASELKDYSELEDIINVGNDKTFQTDGKQILWNSDGLDIFYQGTTTKELPVRLKITYTLDGEEMTPSDMLGKSGKVTITLKYTNLDKRIISVNGKKEELYTPFVVAMGTILDANTNTNVEVHNGKVVANGMKHMIAGIASPGLYESLKLEELKGLDTIKLSYETTKFELGSIYSVITPKVLETSDLDTFKKMDSLYSQVDTLQEGMNTIDAGAKEVVSGSETLKNGVQNAITGLKENTADALSNEQILAIQNQSVMGVKATFTEAYKNSIATSAWNEVKNYLANANDPTVENYVKTSVTSIMTAYLGGETNLTYYGGCLLNNEQACLTLQASGYTLKQVADFQKIVTEQVTGVALSTSNYVAESTSKMVASRVAEQSAIQTAESVTSTLAPTIANQVKTASLEQVTASLSTLYAGVEKLDTGIHTLSSGITKYNQEGIQKVSTLVNTKLKNVTNKLTALSQLADSYNSFAGKEEGMQGETKFVLVIDSKKVPKKSENKVEETTKETFFDRIKNLFK